MPNCQVIKRDGRVVEFDLEKVYVAVKKAIKDTIVKESVDIDVNPLEIAENVKSAVVRMELTDISIEAIQEIVISELLKKDARVAMNYVAYKTEKNIIRLQKSNVEIQLEKLAGRDPSVVNENANKDSNVFNTQRDLTAGISAKSIGIKMLPEHVANAHDKGDIHFHDLDYSPYSAMTNCCLPDFPNMLKNGFAIGNAEVEPPKSINTASAQIAQIIANVASSQYGGTSVDRIDELLEPFAELNYKKHLSEAIEFEVNDIEKYVNEKTNKDIYDAMQGLEYEINTLFTSNG